MGSKSHGLHRALFSLVIPVMVAGSLGNVPVSALAAADLPVTLQATPDTHSKAVNEPAFQHVQRQDKHAIPVQFLGINDLHGNLDTAGSAYVNGHIYQNAGHVDRLAAYLDQSQNQFHRVHRSRNTFRIQAGDIVGASPANSTLLAHESTMQAVNAMKFQIGALGNHEFDQGLGEFNRILKGKRPAKTASAEIQRYPQHASRMQELVANVVNKSDGKQPYGYQPYTIRTVTANGHRAKIGFIGIETHELPTLTYPRNYQNYRILDEAQTIAKYDRVLNKRGVKAVVVMAHTPATNSKTGISGDAVNIMQKVHQLDPKNNVGLYLAAHNHMYANGLVGKTHIVQSDSFAKAYSDVQGAINPKTGQFTHLESHVYPVLSAKDDAHTKPVKRVTKIVADANRRVAPIINAVIGRGTTEIAQTSHNGESPVGELVVDGQLYEANKRGLKADFAITNSGGVRAPLRLNGQQQITWGAAQTVQPFGNILQVIEMSGQQLTDVLNKQYQGGDSELQVAGLTYTFVRTGKTTKIARLTKSDGTPITAQAKYRVVINDFLHSNAKYGFGGTPVVASSLPADTDVFVQYIKDLTAQDKTVVAPQGNRKVAAPVQAAPAA